MISELKGHVITDVKEWKVRTRYPRYMGKNSKQISHGYGHSGVGILEITTSKGASGIGFGRCDRLLYPSLVGRALSEVFDPALGILSPTLYSADLALHDLAGKILGIPVKRMISDSPADRVCCYDGAIYMSDISPDRRPRGVHGIIDDCRSDALERGFTDFKVKIGREKWMGYEAGLARDVEIIRAIRSEFPDCRILVDANDSYTLETTVAFMEAVKYCGIYWFEEPFQEEEEALRSLKAYLKENSPETLIADGEWVNHFDRKNPSQSATISLDSLCLGFRFKILSAFL